jgi:hypothetical protein
MRDESEVLSLGRACPGFVFANAGGRGYYVPYYREDALDRIARHRALLSVAEFASLLDDLRALVRAGAVSPSTAMAWVRYGAASRDWNVLRATLDLAEFYGNTLVTDASRPAFAAFARHVFGPRARTLGFVRKPGESDDDQLARRALLRFVAPYDPELAAQARRLALAWIADRKAVDAGFVDVVLVTAARTGDAAMLEAMVPAAKSTQDRLERRNLTMALLSFDDPALAQKAWGIPFDPSFDVRETWTALRAGRPGILPPCAVRHFMSPIRRTRGRSDATRRADGRYAAGLCSRRIAQVEAFLGARAATYLHRAACHDDRVDGSVHTAEGALIRAADDRQRYSECRRPRP